MYSQYQNFQQNNAATAVASQVWNGRAWVPAGAAANSNYNASYYQPQAAVQPHAYRTTTTTNTQTVAALPTTDRVTTYTQYYHTYSHQAQQYEGQLQQMTLQDPQRPHIHSKAEWAKYHADQCSRAAHFFHANPGAVEAPFALPPAPESNSVTAPVISQHKQQQQQAPIQGFSKNDEEEPTLGLKRYVERCLNQCKTSEERKEMERQVELAIAKSIEQGTYESKDWSVEPLIRLSSWNVKPFKISPRPEKKKHSTAASYYGNAASNDKYFQKLPDNDSYYGSSAPNSKDLDSHYTPKKHKCQKFNLADKTSGYYGPSSTGLGFSASNNSDRSSESPTSNVSLSSSQKISHHKKRSQTTQTSMEEDYISLKPSGKKAKKQPWKKPNDGLDRSSAALAKRANRFAGPGGIQDASSTSNSNVGDYDRYMGKVVLGGSQKELDENDFEKMTVKGTCTTLEKDYLRLTAPPRPELVRPKHILERHLENLKHEYNEKPKKKRRDYLWFCSQFKAVRQDCTVQRIMDSFAVDVYETHARIALMEGDLNEYNQCQTQLKYLYDVVREDSQENGKARRNLDEFVSYRLLYYVFLSTNEKYSGANSDLFKTMLSLTPAQRSNPTIAHALNVREAVADGDYLRFFRLHQSCPTLGHYLTSRMVDFMRIRALRTIVKAYRPSINLDFCSSALGFDNRKEGEAFIVSCGGIVDGALVQTKESQIHEPEQKVKNSLI